eukprot:6200641-Pleurochrysis_carterae.AAC.3
MDSRSPSTLVQSNTHERSARLQAVGLALLGRQLLQARHDRLRHATDALNRLRASGRTGAHECRHMSKRASGRGQNACALVHNSEPTDVVERIQVRDLD